MAEYKWPYAPPTKAVISFSGGPYDGESYVVRGKPTGPGLGPHFFWLCARGGEIGRQFQIVSPARAAAQRATLDDGTTDENDWLGPPQLHVYEVVGRRQDEQGDIFVDIGYRGVSADGLAAE